MTTITRTITRPLLDWLRGIYLRQRIKHCDADIEHCKAGVIALEEQEDRYRDARRAYCAELRSLGGL